MINFMLTGGLLALSLLPIASLSTVNQNQIFNPIINSHDQLEAAQSVAKKEEDSKFILLDETAIQLDVPYINQYDDLPEDRKAQIMRSACGPTALAMSFRYHGVETDLITVIDKLPTSVYVKGVMFYNLYKGGEIYDFETVKIAPNAKEMYETLKSGYPIILNVQNYQGFIGHALVITGIRGYNAETGTAEALIINDPFVGPAGREFKFGTGRTLIQPEGYTNYIGILQPFYIRPRQ